MFRRIIATLLLAVLLLGGYIGLMGGFVFFQQFKAKMIHQALAAMSNPPQTVSTVVATQQEWQPTLQGIDPAIAMSDGRQQAIERAQVTDLEKCTVLQTQPARRPTEPFIHPHAGERDTQVYILAGSDEIFAGQ